MATKANDAGMLRRITVAVVLMVGGAPGTNASAGLPQPLPYTVAVPGTTVHSAVALASSTVRPRWLSYAIAGIQVVGPPVPTWAQLSPFHSHVSVYWKDA